MIANNQLVAGASALAAVFITNLPATNAVGATAAQGPKPGRDGYPPLSKNSYFDSNEGKLLCTFTKDGKKAKSWDFRVNFGVYLTENGLQTESIRCPKFNESNAFEATYSESAVLRRFIPIDPEGPKHSFDRHPPPAHTGLDPLKGMRLESEGSLNGLYAIAKREGFRTTGGLVFIDDKRKAKIQDLHDVTEAIEKLEETCGELLNTVKKQFPSLDKLCFEYDGITKKTVKAVGEGNWRTRDGSKEYRPKK
ncbi:hypothetical protein FOZ63_012407 [Perkinsus olseni]|uniref:Uncharacterized protein n=1 Tax=Perkinsus olseni TaxID=32597 RepID=A0A7J6T4D2_PEROL|nr:hypothetical protein FOZ62_017929 [Perkinsus olseni]KAF4758021.1 hypothetical protein FOZ63_012407 [Perkinsus olseni]